MSERELKKLVRMVFGGNSNVKLASYKPGNVRLYRIELVREEDGAVIEYTNWLTRSQLIEALKTHLIIEKMKARK